MLKIILLVTILFINSFISNPSYSIFLFCLTLLCFLFVNPKGNILIIFQVIKQFAIFWCIVLLFQFLLTNDILSSINFVLKFLFAFVYVKLFLNIINFNDYYKITYFLPKEMKLLLCFSFHYQKEFLSFLKTIIKNEKNIKNIIKLVFEYIKLENEKMTIILFNRNLTI